MSKISRKGKKIGQVADSLHVKSKKSFNKVDKPTAKAYLQVCGTGGGDTGPSVFLFADSQRYVFSCGEATQRLFHEGKFKLGKINNIFLTQLTWQYIGGLPGLLLTLREACKLSLSVRGPLGLSNLLTASRCFLSMNNVDLKCVEYGGENDDIYKDENIVVRTISIKGEEENFSYNSEITEVTGNKDDSLNYDKCAWVEKQRDVNCSKSKNSTSPEGVKNSKRSKLDVRSRTVVSYICELVAMPGKMNIKKALELGVPSGPLLGKLQKGQDVTLENGCVVRANDIMEKSSGSCIFCIIDCPSQYYFKQLQTNKELASYEEGGEQSTTPVVMVHFSPSELIQTQEYHLWTKRFGDSCQHLFLNSEMCAPKVAMFSQLGIQYCLNQLNAEIFPKPFVSVTPEIEMHRDHKHNWTAGEPYLIYHLRPTFQGGYDRTDITSKWNTLAEKVRERQQCLIPAVEMTVSEIENALNDFIDTEKHACKVDHGLETSGSVLAREFKDMDKEFGIVFLGTGASLPSKYRNVSCTLVKISEEKLVLLDCGEGTYGQLFRHYGPKLDDVLRKLRCVFISHIHADHHLGLVRVLRAWEKSTNSLTSEEKPDPILVIGPPSLLIWLRYYGSFCESLYLRFYDSCKFQEENITDIDTLSSLLDSKVNIVPVKHCPRAFGLVLTHEKGWKLVYSGDTRPCDDLIEAGRNATVLIHEATLEDNLQAEALAKQHSTTSEAVQCGQKMQAKFTLLNHFSQRYPKIPVFNEEFNDCVGIAFDHMSVNFQNLCTLPKLLQPLQKLFKEEIEEQRARAGNNMESVEKDMEEL